MQPPSNEHQDGNAENPFIKRRSSKNKGDWRDKLSFWILGLTFKFSSNLILTAAHDINHELLPELKLAIPPRHCFELSTGVILVTNVVPAHLLLFIMPKLPFYFAPQMTIACLLNIVSYLTIALADNIMVALIGIAVDSLGFGIADYSLSTHVIHYKSSIVSKLNSASNLSCVVSSLYYVGLRELKLRMAIAFYSLIPLQLFTLFVIWILLRPPKPVSPVLNLPPDDSEFHLSIFNLEPPFRHFEDKCEYIGHLMRYILPLGLITIMQFFINQGLYEFVYFRKEFLSIDSQYRWLNFIYQVGFYACVTTKTLLVVHHIWIYTMLQFLFMAFFVLDALFFFSKYLWVVMLMVYFEGIISGAAYINTMQKMEAKEPENRMDVAESVMKQSLSLKTILGGILAIMVHYLICRTAEPSAR